MANINSTFDKHFLFGNQDLYNNGNASSALTSDYALIADLENQDIIQLIGLRNDYSLTMSPQGLPSGTGVFFYDGAIAPRMPFGLIPELIGIIADISSENLNLDNTYQFSFVADVQKIPFSNFIAFGDSTTDVGNVFLASEQTFPASPPYFNGRFSNGPLLPEILAEELGLSASIPSLAGGTNYAFGGAELGAGDDEGEPSVGEQINLYLATGETTATDLFFISAGSNNIFSDLNGTPEEIVENIPEIENTVAELTGHITTLANAGAENFIIPNLAPLGAIPLISDAGISSEINTAVTEFNNLLDTELDDLENQLGINIYELDVASEFAKLLENPSDFGFTDTTNRALEALTENPLTDPTEFLWWDDVHPTGTANSLLANALIDDIPTGITQFTTTNFSPLVPDFEGLSTTMIF
ncbi:MAG: SGNH/GDSL hydrolase family protein [Cyanobacteria bacterium P01_D01_bin.50]